ncbi:hypothetical protein V495_05024 [Pseudogymnoascus sp. VKM F-4514 (FW-929)]|nr:hypothetical protein V495_05024 [Pseudogymnoascus sp. VKM F-4514 (FW-929)]KFY63332.1 hypothetical protein V497_02053 [Pseudogymnoascus sp. VKM F-4516 (FW-969)]
MALLICISFAVFIICPIVNYLVDAKSLRRFPSPSPLAALTPFWTIYHNWRGQRYLAVEDAHQKYGPVTRIAPDHLSFAEPKAYKDIYGHGSSIIKDIFYDNLAGDTPSMADTTSRELHSSKRRNVSSVFSAKNITLMEPKVVDTVRKLLDALKHKSEGRKVAATDRYPAIDGEFDLRPWLNMFTFDAFSSMLWSSCYGFLDRGNDDCSSMSEDGTVTTVQAMNSFRAGVHFNTICAQLSPSGYKISRWITQKTYRMQAADLFTGMARYQSVKRLQHTPAEVDFFSFFKIASSEEQASEKKSTSMKLPDLVAECTSFLNAGNDTTQISLTNAIYELATHPAEQQKLYDILRESLPESSRPIASYSELIKIPYLRAVLDETFRVQPPVRFGLPRRTTENGATISGHFIPAGVTVSSSLHTLHRNEGLFHKASEWIPERWIPEHPDVTSTEWQNLKDYVLPFTLGGRACIGRNLAYMELSICLAALVMAFDWRVSSEQAIGYAHYERLNSSPVELMVSATARPESWNT